MSSLSQIAKDPSCLFCLTPDRGGSWLSRLRPPTPRNFADKPKPWPSSVPENFAEKSKAFYDCQEVMREALDPTHDYSFLIDAEIVRENSDCSMFYAGGENFPFGVYVYSTHTIRVFSNLLRSASDTSSKYATVAVYSGDTRLQGRHTIEVIIEGDTMHAFLDGTEIEHPYAFARAGTAAVRFPICNSGYVYKIQIEDLTTGKIVWSYPTWEERTRLLTKTNVRTDRGVFEAADDTQVAGIATPLDFRGNTTSKTFIVRAFCPAHDPDAGRFFLHPFISQGNAGSGATGFTFHFSIREDRQSGLIQIYPVVSNGRVFYSAYADASELLDSWHVFAFSIEHLPESTILRSFVDGVQVGSSSNPAFAWGTPSATTTLETTIGIRRDPNSSYYAGSLTRISSAMIFDRALTQPEIAAISNTLR
jgi:hypothetical protein